MGNSLQTIPLPRTRSWDSGRCALPFWGFLCVCFVFVLSISLQQCNSLGHLPLARFSTPAPTPFLPTSSLPSLSKNHLGDPVEALPDLRRLTPELHSLTSTSPVSALGDGVHRPPHTPGPDFCPRVARHPRPPTALRSGRISEQAAASRRSALDAAAERPTARPGTVAAASLLQAPGGGDGGGADGGS